MLGIYYRYLNSVIPLANALLWGRGRSIVYGNRYPNPITSTFTGSSSWLLSPLPSLPLVLLAVPLPDQWLTDVSTVVNPQRKVYPNDEIPVRN